jgi:aerobic-type carbon monoxide dehydrogenase small subunit (CoxS/CutS family)
MSFDLAGPQSLEEALTPLDPDIRHSRGGPCRCGGSPQTVEAVQIAAGQRRAASCGS